MDGVAAATVGMTLGRVGVHRKEGRSAIGEGHECGGGGSAGAMSDYTSVTDGSSAEGECSDGVMVVAARDRSEGGRRRGLVKTAQATGASVASAARLGYGLTQLRSAAIPLLARHQILLFVVIIMRVDIIIRVDAVERVVQSAHAQRRGRRWRCTVSPL